MFARIKNAQWTRESLREHLFKVLRYVGIGLCGWALGYLIFVCLYWPRLVEEPQDATRLAGWLSYPVGFFLHRKFTFRDTGGGKRVAWQLPADAFLQLVWNIGILAPFLVVYAIQTWGWSPYTTQAIVPFAVAIQNYLIRMGFIFSSRVGSRRASA